VHVSKLKGLRTCVCFGWPERWPIFAELGAEVMRSREPKNWRGCNTFMERKWRKEGGFLSAYFCCCNWVRNSSTGFNLPMKGTRTVQKLAAQSDVIIASYKPGDAEKLGVAYEQLKANNEQLIYGQITGYGADDRVKNQV